MDINVLVTLLTIAVVLLSAVIITMLVIAIALLVKVRRIAKSADAVMQNIASATEWIAPAKILSKLFRNKEK
jgi:hypothetical protein